MKALVIFSGGQDSTTCLYWALSKFERVEAISFFYGQKHSVELDQSRIICEQEGVKQTIIDISFLGTIVESALTSNGDVNALNKKGLPASFVPNRNALFLTLAHAYAQKIGCNDLVTGVCQTDFSGYPDCRQGFIESIRYALNEGSDSEIKIHTPMMHLTKAQTWQMAAELGHISDVVKLSHTCYNGDRENAMPSGFGCGTCPACVLREKGYQEFINSPSTRAALLS